MIPAREALARLREGNERFVAEVRAPKAGESRRREVSAGQEPFAIILGCSDSRVPAELVFDQGLGDLFVIRVAGNIVAPSQVGSVEFAAELIITALLNSARSHAKNTPAITANLMASGLGGIGRRDAKANGTKISCANARRQNADVQPGSPDHRAKRADQPMANTPSASTAYARVLLMWCGRGPAVELIGCAAPEIVPPCPPAARARRRAWPQCTSRAPPTQPRLIRACPQLPP